MWNLAGKPARIIKVTQDEYDKNLGNKFQRLLSYLQEVDSPAVVKIYDFGSINIKGESPYYFHIMEKLNPIPRNTEEQWIESILSEFYNSRKNIPSFCSQNIRDFLYWIKKLKFKYHDLHSRNVMLDCDGKFKLIDLEGFLQ